jgi:hypothetical protein
MGRKMGINLTAVRPSSLSELRISRKCAATTSCARHTHTDCNNHLEPNAGSGASAVCPAKTSSQISAFFEYARTRKCLPFSKAGKLRTSQDRTITNMFKFGARSLELAAILKMF